MNRQSVCRNKAAYLKKGRSALAVWPARGRPPKLPTRLTPRLERELLRAAKATRFTSDRWTYPRVARLIVQHFRTY